MQRNKEGYADPTPAQAIRNMSWEELQRHREKRHGVKRGDIVTLQEKYNDGPGRPKIAKYRARILELYKFIVLVEFPTGERRCFGWHDFKRQLINEG